ncbi:MAG: repeat-containing protein, partial [Segetibacter sp.]|nr:repeat-containing protein [Segetibacter sp.]
SSDNKWLVTINTDSTAKVWELPGGTPHDFLKHEKKINYADFSRDSKWLSTINTDSTVKAWGLPGGTPYNFLKDEKNIDGVVFLPGHKLLVTTLPGHKFITWDIASSKVQEQIWFSQKPVGAEMLPGNQLYVAAGKNIIKLDLETRKDKVFYYVDSDKPLDYTFEEIQEWMHVFGDRYLLPLSDEIKVKYGIKYP